MDDKNCATTYSTTTSADNILLDRISNDDDQTFVNSSTTKVRFKVSSAPPPPNCIKYVVDDSYAAVSSAEYISIDAPISYIDKDTSTNKSHHSIDDDMFAHNVMLLAGNDFQKICRACLSKSDDLQTIFDTGLSDMIVSFAAVQVSVLKLCELIRK